MHLKSDVGPSKSDVHVLSYDYPPNDGGISRLSAQLVLGLTHLGRRVHVLTLQTQRQGGLPRPCVSTTVVSRGLLRRIWATWRYLRHVNPGSAIVATVWNPEATIAWLARRQNVIVMAHGNEVMKYPDSPHYAIRTRIRRRVLSSANLVVCNSSYTESLVKQAAPLSKTTVINPGVDTLRYRPLESGETTSHRFGLPQDRLIVLTVSRLDAYKGHEAVLDALARLRETDRARLHYVVAGQGPNFESLRARSSELGLDSCVTWLGFVADEDLPSLYRCAHLFVLLTREEQVTRGVEGFGMAFLEAQASGVPVVGTRIGGIPDAVHEGEGGWLVAEGDIAEVRNHLARLVRHPEHYQSQGSVARLRMCREAGWDLYTKEINIALRSACE